MPSQLPSVSPMIGLLRSSTLAYLLSSIPQHTHESTHAPLLFIITTLIMIDNTLANQHAQQTKYLQTHRTHLAPTFSHASWRAFSFPTFSNLVSSHPEIAVRMIQHAFYDTPLNEISRRNAAVALRVLFTGYELYESLETFENDVKELCEMIKPLGTYSERDTALNFIRPNNEITCHGPLTPLYYPLIVSAPRYAVRLLSNVFLAHVQQYIRRTCPDTNLTFWSRVTDVNQPTVVFFHGIGLGVIPYLGMITGFLRYGDVKNVILVEFPGISGLPLRDSDVPYPASSEVTASILGHLKSTVAPDTGVIAVAHSFGTMVLSSIVNTHPKTFSRCVYLDPVSFFGGATSLWPSLFCPLNVRIFLKCIAQCDPIKFVTHLAAGDLYTQHLVKQVMYFGEYANQEKDENGLVVLSGRDHLVDARAVRDTVKEGTEVWFYEEYMHGDIIVRDEFYRRLGEWVKGVCEELNGGKMRRAGGVKVFRNKGRVDDDTDEDRLFQMRRSKSLGAIKWPTVGE